METWAQWYEKGDIYGIFIYKNGMYKFNHWVVDSLHESSPSIFNHKQIKFKLTLVYK